jgi:hypothetical protein
MPTSYFLEVYSIACRWHVVPKISLFYYYTLDGGRTFSRSLRLSVHAGRTYAKVLVQKKLTPSSSTPKFFVHDCFSACPHPVLVLRPDLDSSQDLMKVKEFFLTH